MIDTNILHLRDQIFKLRGKIEETYVAIQQSSGDGEVVSQLAVARAHLIIVEALLHQACGTTA